MLFRNKTAVFNFLKEAVVCINIYYELFCKKQKQGRKKKKRKKMEYLTIILQDAIGVKVVNNIAR